MSEFTPTVTTWIIIGTTLLWAFWDIYLYQTNQLTISEKMNGWGKKILPIVFALGFLCGHWFW